MDQRSNEWFIEKLGRFSASEAKTIATQGVGLKTLAYNKCIERILLDREEINQNDAMIRGQNLEPNAREAYEKTKNVLVKEDGFIIADEWYGCSPDGLVNEDGGIEIKCMNNHHHLVAVLYDYIKPEHYAQIQMNLMVTKRQWWDYVCYNPDLMEELQLKITRVYPDEEFFEKILKGIEKGKEIIEEGLKKYKEILK